MVIQKAYVDICLFSPQGEMEKKNKKHKNAFVRTAL